MITANRIKGHYRNRGMRGIAVGGESVSANLLDLADDRSEMAQRWDEEHNQHVVRRLLEWIGTEFSEEHVLAFRRVVLEDASAALVADEQGMTLAAVLKAKSADSQPLTRDRQRAANNRFRVPAGNLDGHTRIEP